MSFLKEFKTFAMRGNVVDMAVGIIIGGAFGKIVSSLVSDIIMPPIGLLIGGVKFESLKIVLKHAHTDAVTGKVTEAVSINYGNFINTALDFLIIAFSIFLFVKLINSMKRKEETKPTPPPAPSKEEQLLTEIRDLLKGKTVEGLETKKDPAHHRDAFYMTDSFYPRTVHLTDTQPTAGIHGFYCSRHIYPYRKHYSTPDYNGPRT